MSWNRLNKCLLLSLQLNLNHHFSFKGSWLVEGICWKLRLVSHIFCLICTMVCSDQSSRCSFIFSKSALITQSNFCQLNHWKKKASDAKTIHIICIMLPLRHSTAVLTLHALAVVTWSARVPSGRCSFDDLFQIGASERHFWCDDAPHGICQQSKHYDCSIWVKPLFAKQSRGGKK